MLSTVLIRFLATETTVADSGDGLQLEGPEPVTINPLDPAFWDPMIEQLRSFQQAAIAFIPRLVVGIVAMAIALFVARYISKGIRRTLAATSADPLVVNVIGNIARYSLAFIAVLFGLAAAGIPIGTVLGGLAVLGIAIAFAVQDIGENLISGILVMFRKPFEIGDQIVTGDYEGTVDDIDLRATTLIDYDGETILIPNRDVYRNPLTNLTKRGSRRTRVAIGVGYDDDQDAARATIYQAARQIEGVLDEPDVQVYLKELGDSSVNFEIRYWTKPDIGTVRSVQDRLISGVKRALDDGGFEIPWPIRTLKFDGTFPGTDQAKGETNRP